MRSTSIRKKCPSCVATEMEALASESTVETSSVCEATRHLGLPAYLVCSILHDILDFYHYKLKLSHELLPTDIVQRKAFARQIPLASLTSCGQMKLIFPFRKMSIPIIVVFMRNLINMNTRKIYRIPESNNMMWVHQFIYRGPFFERPRSLMRQSALTPTTNPSLKSTAQ